MAKSGGGGGRTPATRDGQSPNKQPKGEGPGQLNREYYKNSAGEVEQEKAAASSAQKSPSA